MYKSTIDLSLYSKLSDQAVINQLGQFFQMSCKHYDVIENATDRHKLTLRKCIYSGM